MNYAEKDGRNQIHMGRYRKNMNEVAIYLEIWGLATDEDGNPGYAGMKITLGKTEKEIGYKELTKAINIKEVLEVALLERIVEEKDTRIITPEEYREKYEEVENDEKR